VLLGSSSIRLVSLSKEANRSFEVRFSVEVLYLVSRVIPIRDSALCSPRLVFWPAGEAVVIPSGVDLEVSDGWRSWSITCVVGGVSVCRLFVRD